MPKIKAVVFDVDGTLLDTIELIRVGYVATLREYGFDSEADALEVRKLSLPLKESYQSILGPSVADDVLQKMLDHHRRVQDASVDVITAHVGLESLLKELRGQGVKIGVFTSGSIEHMERNFKQVKFDMYKQFDALVTADDTHIAHKPAPDGLLLCLERLGVEPQAAVFVGDHPADMQAGKAANVAATIGLLHGLGRSEDLQIAGADYLLPSLAEIPAVLEQLQ